MDNLSGKRNCQKFTYNWQNKENNFIFFYKPPKSKKIKRIQCITLLLHLSEYCAELKSYLYTLQKAQEWMLKIFCKEEEDETFGSI